MQLNYQDRFHALPSFEKEDLRAMIRLYLHEKEKYIIVLDDDPTGTQTVHDIPVLTVWDANSIEGEVQEGSRLFYILTNSRSMPREEADELHHSIGLTIDRVFDKLHKEYILISRGDSTLRGHFPNDILALAGGLKIRNFITAFIPAFFEGGRYTINDIHYVKEEDDLIPVAETIFSKDKTFGFKHSDLCKWIEEKSEGLVRATDVVSFSLETLRGESTERVAERIKSMPAFSYCIVNAAAYYDIEKFSIAYLQSGVRMLFRTSASFVKAISGLSDKELLSKSDLVGIKQSNGGLIVVGSYVSKTTSQLSNLLVIESLTSIEIDVLQVLSGQLSVSEVIRTVNKYIEDGKDLVVFTSRLLHSTGGEVESLAIGNQVSAFITAVVAGLTAVPKFIVAKGGITSSDIATKSLGIKRAIVLGQALPGIPVWLTGFECKYPGLPFIIFPGNVGDKYALANLYKKLTC